MTMRDTVQGKGERSSNPIFLLTGDKPEALDVKRSAQAAVNIKEAVQSTDTEPAEHIFVLTDAERDAVGELIASLPALNVRSVQDDLLTRVEMAGRQMPQRLAETLIRFRRQANRYGSLLIRNLPTDPVLPDTPRDGKPAPDKKTFFSEYSLLMTMLQLGEPISYSDEKDGVLIQNICPVAGHEAKQENTGSTYLEFHTEDGFHPYKPDYLGLVCLRSDHERLAETATASIRNVLHVIPSTAITLLRQPLFRLRLSTSFLHGANSKEMYSAAMPVLTGNLLQPEMCVDYFLMEATTPEAKWALELLKAELLKVASGFVLLPGDMVLIDNRLAAHARTGFTPRYDGKDRWLQRCFTVEDFRRSAFSRSPGQHICSPLSIVFSMQDVG